MRLRPIAALSVAALTALLLAGCSSASTPDASSSASATDLCSAAAPSGEASDSITINGTVGQESTVSFTTPLAVTDLERTVVSEGSGDPVQAGDLIEYALSAFSADTGEKLGSVGYTDGEVLPQQISADSVLGQIIGCSSPGSRFAVTYPGTEDEPGEVYVVDFLRTVPAAAWGTSQTPVAGFPTVTLADNGQPTLSVPSDLATPDTTQVETLKKGDGATVADGDTVLVQYTGVLVDGTVFDSSWTNGTPASFATNQVVTGFGKALVGQTVGSQVVAVIPPAEGYGDTAQGTIPAGSTLIFVVDILGTQSAAATQ